MKKFYPFILLGGLLFLISISTIAALTGDGSPTLIEGEDCVEYHDDTYMVSYERLDYIGAAQPGYELDFSLTYNKAASGIIFEVTVELQDFPEDLILREGSPLQIKPIMDSDSFTAAWVITSNTEGNFTFDVKSTVSVCYIRYHSSYIATYEYWHTASFEVSADAVGTPYLAADLPEGDGTTSAPRNWKYITGQLLGFLSLLSVYISIQLARFVSVHLCA